MALRKSMPLSDLSLPKSEQDKHETTYQASRGGHFPAPEKPVPGTPKDKR